LPSVVNRRSNSVYVYVYISPVLWYQYAMCTDLTGKVAWQNMSTNRQSVALQI